MIILQLTIKLCFFLGYADYLPEDVSANTAIGVISHFVVLTLSIMSCVSICCAKPQADDTVTTQDNVVAGQPSGQPAVVSDDFMYLDRSNIR